MQESISGSEMTNKTLIVVEGNEDENFLKSYIETLGYPNKNFRFLSVNGKDNLEASESIIEDALDRGSQVLKYLAFLKILSIRISGILKILHWIR